MSAMASQIIGVSIVQAQIKDSIKAQRHWPLSGESTDNQWIPFTNGQWREMYPFDDVIMMICNMIF